MDNATWQPVADGSNRFADGVEVQVAEKGAWLFVADGYKVVPVGLPANYRICERVPDNRPRPDWSQAPNWAKWWACNAEGWAYWYREEPETSGVEWDLPDTGEMIRRVSLERRGVEIPIGIDWRLCIERRPEPQS